MSERDPATIGKLCRRPDILGGRTCIAGTRVPARAVQSFWQAGYSVAAIMAEYPGITEADVKAALGTPTPAE